MTKEEIDLYYELGGRLTSEAEQFADEYAKRINILFSYKEIDYYRSGIYIKYQDEYGDYAEGLEINNEDLSDPTALDRYVVQYKKEQDIENKKQIKDEKKDCRNLIEMYQKRLQELEGKNGTS